MSKIPDTGSRCGGGCSAPPFPRMTSLIEVVAPSNPPIADSNINVNTQDPEDKISNLCVLRFLSACKLGSIRDSLESVFDHHVKSVPTLDGASFHLRFGLISICRYTPRTRDRYNDPSNSAASSSSFLLRIISDLLSCWIISSKVDRSEM